MEVDATVPSMSEPDAARPTSFSRVSLGIMAHASLANLLGTVHGGEVMKLADSTAGAVANRHCGGPAVTASMDEMTFLSPIRVGDIIKNIWQVNLVGNTSMEIGVRVEAQPWSNAGDEPVHVASAYFAFVAIGEDARPRRVPAVIPETEEDRRRYREAEIRRAHRLARMREIDLGRA